MKTSGGSNVRVRLLHVPPPWKIQPVRLPDLSAKQCVPHGIGIVFRVLRHALVVQQQDNCSVSSKPRGGTALEHQIGEGKPMASAPGL